MKDNLKNSFELRLMGTKHETDKWISDELEKRCGQANQKNNFYR